MHMAPSAALLSVGVFWGRPVARGAPQSVCGLIRSNHYNNYHERANIDRAAALLYVHVKKYHRGSQQSTRDMKLWKLSIRAIIHHPSA